MQLTLQLNASFQRLFIFIILCWINGTAFSSTPNPLKINVHLKADSISLQSALDSLSKQCNVYFTYNSTILKPDSIVSINSNGRTLRFVLGKLLNSQEYRLTLIKKQVVISKRSTTIDPTSNNNSNTVNNTTSLVKGYIKDAVSKTPLPYVNIGVLGKFAGTISNEDGYFELKLSQSNNNDVIGISFMGYRDMQLSVRELLNTDTTLYLNPSHISLQEIIVRTRDPQILLQIALKNFETNYYNNASNHTSFYREWVTKRKKYITYVESVLDVYKPRYIGPGSNVGFANLIRSRKFSDVSLLDTVSFKLQGGVDACLQLDITRELPAFLDDEFRHRYNYQLADIQILHETPVYQIHCEPKNKLDLLVCGTVYINAQTMAIEQTDLHYPTKVAERMGRSMIKKRSRGYRAKSTQISYSVNYKKVGNKYHFNHSKGNLTYKIRKKRSLFSNTFHVQFEMATTSIDTINTYRIPISKRLPSSTIMVNKSYTYTDKFWGNYSIVQPEKNIQEAIKRVNANLLKINTQQ